MWRGKKMENEENDWERYDISLRITLDIPFLGGDKLTRNPKITTKVKKW
jgi:hypothetical protein